MKEEIKLLKQANKRLQYENYKLKKKIIELRSLIRESEEDNLKEQEFNNQVESIKDYFERRKNLWK